MQVHVSSDPTTLSQEVAEWMTSLIQKKLSEKDRFYLLLSGGNTPKSLYTLLAEDRFKKRIDWKRIHIFFGDERAVPFKDKRNNGKMAFDTLISKIPIPKNQVHYINTNVNPELGSQDYSRLLHQYFDLTNSTFDLALLGMGDDGHTLSIFPGTEAMNEHKNWVIAIYVPSQNMYRITLTPDVVNRSACIAFLVTGTSKAPVLKKILNGTPATGAYPAQLINPVYGELHWFVDDAACGT